jgi:diguanylate cyclase (GGDEF)-like protein
LLLWERYMPQQVLLIQADPADARTVRQALSSVSDEPFEVTWVSSCAAGLERLVRGEHPSAPVEPGIDAIVVDLALSDCQGIQTFERLIQVAPGIPILVLCATADEPLARLAVQLGAQDYLLKTRLDNYLLPKAIRNMIERAANAGALFEDKERAQVTLDSIGDGVMSTARALSHRMSDLAQHDTLTDLPNRVLLKDRITQAIGNAQRHQQQLAVLCLNLDNFKQLNDSLGHGVGDRVLQWVANRLVSCVRSTDTVSRQEGDEFVILLSQVTCAQDADVCAETLLSALSMPACIERHDLYLSASIGIATYPGDGTDADTILRHADRALYHAKHSGSNNYKFFEPGMNGRVVERQSLENGLRQGIDRGQFVLHYQPIINLITGAIIGVEALLRWRHPQRGLVLPAQFMRIAEESGLIVPIGQWVLRESVRQGRSWRDAGLSKLRMAINVSAAEFHARDFLSGVDAILSETGFAPGDLEFDLTEAFLMRESKAISGVLQELKSIGVRITLDDFGTGQANLSHLRRLPIDALKIDQSFIRDLTVEGGNASIVNAIISMGRGLRIQVVAEGVETRRQFECLRQQSCPEGQGFFFSRAVDAEDFAQVLGRGISAPSLSEGTGASAPYPRLIAANT